MTAKAGWLAQMFKTLDITSDEAKKAVDMLGDAEIVNKSVPHAETTGSSEHITDRWMQGEMHKVPSAEQLKVGPAQESSGAGAEKMVKEYSNPAPQQGLVVQAEQLAHELGSIRGYMKALADGHNSLADAFGNSNSLIKSLAEQNRKTTLVLAGILAKAEEEDEKKEEHKEDAEKAQKAFAKAQKLFKKAKQVKGEAKAASSVDIANALRANAKQFRKAALSYLKKADLYATASREVRTAVDMFLAAKPALKADMDHFKDDEEEEKKAKKAYKAMKAAAPVEDATKAQHGETGGNQADKQDGETKNQDDSAAKALIDEMNIKIDNALSGFGMLKTDVAGLIETMTNRSVTPKVEPLALMKADAVTAVRTIDQKIEKMADDGTLDPNQEHRARDLLQKFQAVRDGQMMESTWKTLVANSAPVVKSIFSEAA